MGRITRDSMRVRLNDAMAKLKRKYRSALKEDEMQRAFDEFWPSWAGEQAAMIYSEVLSALDLLLLTAAVDNRRQIGELRRANEEARRLLEELREAQR